jgi:phosphohistidine phosphatase SixA
MIVGHLPSLDKLASLLVSRNENGGVVLFRYSAIVCVEKKEDRGWALRWIFASEMAH